MSRLCVVPVVEGHGEVDAIRTLLQRIWIEIVGGEYLHVVKPIRKPRSNVGVEKEIAHMLDLAAAKLAEQKTTDPKFVLVLADSDGAAPCLLGPTILKSAVASHAHVDIGCVLAHKEYESWFAAAPESLGKFIDFDSAPEDSEKVGKKWIEDRFRKVKYSPAVDQAKLTAALDLARCRARSPSFDKLCRELEKRRPQADPPTEA